MVSQIWLDMVSGYAQLWGVSPSAMLIIIAVLFALGSGAGLGIATKNKTIGMLSFAMTLFVFFVIGFIDWFMLLIPIIIVAGYQFGIKGGGI